MFDAVLIGIIVGLCRMDMFFGYSMFSRPIVAASLAGLMLGDIETGVIIGGVLEVVFMGSFAVGAAVSPDGGSAAAIGTAFAIKSGGGIAIGSAFAVPLALIGGFLFVLVKMVNSIFSQIMLKQLEEGNDGRASITYVLGCWLGTFTLYFLFGFLAVYFGSDTVTQVVAKIPVNVINGLSSAANMLPAVGFAMLLRMILNKEVTPYFFIGFMLSAYLKLPVIAVTLFAAAIVLIIQHNRDQKLSFNNMEDDSNEF